MRVGSRLEELRLEQQQEKVRWPSSSSRKMAVCQHLLRLFCLLPRPSLLPVPTSIKDIPLLYNDVALSNTALLKRSQSRLVVTLFIACGVLWLMPSLFG
jgi:hypothetical protein